MKVTLFGHEYEVIFNMAVQIEFEEMSGIPFAIENLDSQKHSMQLYYASLKVANNKLPFTFDQMIGKEPFDLELGLSVGEVKELKDAVISEVCEWFAIPKVMLEEEKPQTDESPKNA